MGTIRFGAGERPKLLARAVLAYDEAGAPDDLIHPLVGLARALDAGDGKRFDELLTEAFSDVALKAIGVGPAALAIEPEDESAAE